MAVTLLGSKALMSIVKIEENGVAQDFYVVQHNAYSVGRTLLLRRYVHSNQKWHTSNVNTYATSSIDAWFNGTYYNTLRSDIKNRITAVDIPYTPGNGNNGVTTLSRKIFALSLTELGKQESFVNVEGVSLPAAGNLQVARNYSNEVVQQWSRSPNIYDIQYVGMLAINGNAATTLCTATNVGARPAFTLPSSLCVDDSGNIIVNEPPDIVYNGQTMLGDIIQSPQIGYTVTDADGNSVTVTEKLDGDVKRTYNPALGAYQRFQAVTPTPYQTILNGPHTLTIEASDGIIAAAPVTITFTKKQHSCSITLASPLPANTMPTAMRLSIVGSIPGDAIWTAEVCNNAFDSSPSWESIKSAIQARRNYLFQNTVSTAGIWGVNFRIAIQRGSADNGGYISGIEGGFK